jgi:hypothetical protein
VAIRQESRFMIRPENDIVACLGEFSLGISVLFSTMMAARWNSRLQNQRFVKTSISQLELLRSLQCENVPTLKSTYEENKKPPEPPT